ncbi:MAG TPA: apolipoprotein N-acyltransferase [Myxococcota bacterium]|jgi:apolipoprotein N-acyltransferase
MPESTKPPAPRWLLAALSGVLLGLSQPIVIESLGDEPIDPTGLSGCLALIGFVPLLLALRGTGPKQAYKLGFLACFIQFTVNVQWLVVAMVVFGRIPLVASWLILSILSAAMAAYVATAFAVTRMLVGRYRWPMWLVFPLAICAAETLRNFGPVGGFPWGNVGTSFATVPVLLQVASLFGVHGLVFCAGLSSSSLAEVIATRGKNRRAIGTFIGLLVFRVGFGALRLATAPTDVPTVKVGLLQGNIEQGIRNDEPWTGRKILDRYHALQADAIKQGAQILVWPEAAFPIRLRRDLKSFEGELLVDEDNPQAQVPRAAVVGAVGYEVRRVDGHREDVHSNSAYIVGADQKVVGRVDKTHLVPFGEYVPWPLGAIVRQIVPIGGTEPGDGYAGIPVTVTTSAGEREVKLGTTICYEGIFPEIARNLRRAGAELHVNITNDGWYGISGAPTQHLDFYALRAVESGMPVVRAANTGKSAWIDTRGRIHDVTHIYTDSAVVADVPLATSDTLYVTLGEWLSLPITVFILAAWFATMIGGDVLRRKRHAIESALGFVGVAIAACGSVAYIGFLPQNEKTATQFLVLVLAGLLIGIGALSGRPWGRKAQIVVGIVMVVVGLIAAWVSSLVLLLLSLLGGGLALLAYKRKAEYLRTVDPLAVAGQ